MSILCLPIVPLVLAGGALFGPVTGTLLSLFCSALGATLGFCISRYFKPDEYKIAENSRVMKLILQVERQGWKSVAMLRLTPAIPYNLVNYGLGLTCIKFSHYLIATIIFIIPNKIIVTCCGYYGVNVFDQIKRVFVSG